MTGRPTKLDQTCRLEDGTTITCAEQLIAMTRLGLDTATAAAHTGISRQTAHNWQLTAARHRATQAQGGTLTKQEQKFVTFLDGMERARAEFEAGPLSVITNAAQGGREVVKITERHLPSGKVERTEVRETARPEWTAAAWLLERRLPDKYRRRTEITGADGAPLVPPAERARSIDQSIADFEAGAATGRELADSDQG